MNTPQPLKLSAPISESLIRSPYPLCRYNFHFLNGPLLVSLPNAQRHTLLFSDTQPASANRMVSRRGWKIVISSLNFLNYIWGFEHISRDQWLWKCMNSYMTAQTFSSSERKRRPKIVHCSRYIPTHCIVLLQCIYIKYNPAMRSENVFSKAIAGSQHAYQGYCFHTYPPQTQKHLFSQSESNVKTRLYSPKST